MALSEKRTVKKLIRDLLLVLGLGIAAGLAVSLAVLYYLGSSGVYTAGNVLISPEAAPTLSYSAYEFDRIEFLYPAQKMGEWRRITVPREAYKRYYSLISSDESLSPAPENIVSLFTSGNPASLTILVKTNQIGQARQTEVFQEVQILSDNYYRIQIRDNQNGKSWAYFFHDHIYAESIKIFSEND